MYNFSVGCFPAIRDPAISIVCVSSVSILFQHTTQGTVELKEKCINLIGVNRVQLNGAELSAICISWHNLHSVTLN